MSMEEAQNKELQETILNYEERLKENNDNILIVFNLLLIIYNTYLNYNVYEK